MLVTQIDEVKSGRYKVYLNEERAFILYKGELFKYHIVEGEEISQDIYEQIMIILKKRAKLRCMNLLKLKDYTEFQLREKLNQGAYPENIIDEVMVYLAGYSYLDDERFTSHYIDTYAHHKSKTVIGQDLDKKGIPKEMQRQMWQQWLDEGNEVDEEALIIHWVEKKRWNLATCERKEIQRIYQFLLRKGFNFSKISYVLSQYQSEEIV